MARPTKAEHERRDARLSPVRVTLAEKLHVEEQAHNAGLSVADFLRTLALYEEVKPPKSKIDAGFLMELNRIGVNLNQLAHAANTGRTEKALITYAIDELVALMKRIDGGG